MWNSVAMDVDSPPGSRLFVVCGKAVEAAVLELAFSPYGHVQSIKIVREKGVAYVKYDKASSAALAMEALNGAVLNNGRGPKLKVLLADSPNQRSIQPKPMMQEQEVSNDPDNVPPRSRLFIVVPKQAEAQHIQDDLGSFPDLEYCKTDLIASKGVVFCKFTKSSSALRALEDITQRGTVAGYKVKCMLAEPKTKRGRPEGAHQEVYSPMHQAAKLHDYGLPPDAAMAAGMAMKLPGASLSPSPIPGVPMPDYSSIGSLSGLVSGIGMAGVAGAIAMSDALSAGSLQPELRALTQVGLGGYAMGMGVPNGSPVSPSSSPVLSKQRLFVVVHKSITSKEGLERLFRRFPGMEYFDLKMDKNHPGRNKGFGFVNYSTPEAAAAAVEQLNGFEFPPQSGHRIKVMHAEPLLGVKHNSGLPSPMPINSPSPVHTPLSRGVAADLASVQDSLAKMSMPRVGSGNGVEDLDRHMASPVNSTHTVARELMFTTS